MINSSFISMGTNWKITIWDKISEKDFEYIIYNIKKKAEEFDSLYSRFKKDSLITKLSDTTGIFQVPEDLVKILKIYKSFYELSEKKFTPCIGNTLSDLGYDEVYSLKEKESIREVPDFEKSIEILDDTHIKINEKVLLDIGAVGKGYFVDKIRDYLDEKKIKCFLVDGSGDVYYKGNKEITSGLEHPKDFTKVIGITTLKNISMCASATNRRSWGKHNHYIDPSNFNSPTKIIATWVKAKDTAISDGISSLLFFVPPEKVNNYEFEYLILNKDMMIKKSDGFAGEVY